ncbi:MAG: hypothetical protein GXO87_04595 [Chlorobi bacterium]|nr:hypothetical protein [Chlorobiota bacterium]
MKNRKAVFFGILSGALVVFFGSEIFQAAAALAAGNVEYAIAFNYAGAATKIYSPSSLPFAEALFLFLSPVIFSIALIEFAHYLLKRKPIGTARFSLVIFNLIVSGYLIVKIFYGVFVSIAAPDIYSDWSGLMNYLGMEFSTKIVFGIFSILLLMGYFNLSSRRIMKYIGK